MLLQVSRHDRALVTFLVLYLVQRLCVSVQVGEHRAQHCVAM